MNDKRLPPKPETLRKLYIFSGNMCAMPDCENVLIDKDGTWLGEVAHIHAASDGGPRANTSLSQEERREAKNLILLCRKCHRKIDSDVEQYPAETLIKIKERHEGLYIKGLEQAELKDCMDEYTPKLPDSLGAWGIMRSDEEYEDARKSLKNVTDRLAKVPTDTRDFLAKCLKRSSERRPSARNPEFEVLTAEIKESLSKVGIRISNNDIRDHVQILYKYDFAYYEEIDDLTEHRELIVLKDEGSVLSTARSIAEDEQAVTSEGHPITLETILVRLDFSSFENASKEQSNSGKGRPSRKKRRAKSSRHTK
jgi:hypothetical protein